MNETDLEYIEYYTNVDVGLAADIETRVRANREIIERCNSIIKRMNETEGVTND